MNETNEGTKSLEGVLESSGNNDKPEEEGSLEGPRAPVTWSRILLACRGTLHVLLYFLWAPHFPQKVASLGICVVSRDMILNQGR